MTTSTLARLPELQEGSGGASPRRRLQSNKPLAQWRKARAIQLATQGRTYQQIADELGYANRGTVHRVVQPRGTQPGCDQHARGYPDRVCSAFGVWSGRPGTSLILRP